ncbi:class II aldolase/adducin N-terminal [Aspergillus caelatus]|uniref:Class II aldolase/adducin N-terminal n=1 Tax=Aspergillus caelatus TaxID=61420 RepID=A0A5N7AKN5_9EURO|nr:class II aldolase/adducin N-terminal [Aspergillus caelatus]KAE8370452.1 class II aldolase/adducin N-terminal [Aspergillus caelatus]
MSSTTTTIVQDVQLHAKHNEASDSPAGLSACGTGGYPVPGVPKFDDPYKKRQWQLEHMAGAFRVFARKGFTEGTAGHISVRDPVEPSTFWINPLGKHFGLLKASDMVHVNEEGQVIGGNKVAVNAAGFMIHSAIHKARPDIHAACHAHSPAGKAWSTFGRPVEILNQDSCTFYAIQRVYQSFGGVVLEADEGKRLAETLGKDGRVAILQNHGLLTAGSTVDEAAYLFTSLERTCEVQLMVDAAKLPKNIIGDKEAEYTAKVNADPETLYYEFQTDFEYEIWKSKGELSKGE